MGHTWGIAQLNDVQLGHYVAFLQCLLGKRNHVAGSIAPVELQGVYANGTATLVSATKACASKLA